MFDHDTDPDELWYYNQKTGQAEQGRVSGFSQRLGPYKTREEAEHALEIARQRTIIADQQDEADNEQW
ncbi:hypothetical protein EML15_02490 [Corynebacterium sp. sy017]|nr:hypothetical protein [Corynebacterium sp. sy017]QDZ43580.1 hypothetical protein FQV43_07255 [Corynebacterium sp. sy039]TSD92756.1 hypothetical protein ELY17_02490 [Corynebacterium sp. SY003]